ncbi:MAG: DsbA family protein [Candidatus Sericytochromatia bacterium]
MLIEFWLDLVCPYSYIGRRHLEAALGRFSQRDAVEVILRSFELDPDAPRNTRQTLPESLMARTGESSEDVEAMLARITAKATEAGLSFRLHSALPTNTHDAHRLLYLAAEQGFQLQAAERLQAAYFCEGEAIGEPETLVRLLAEIGMDPASVRKTLDYETFSHEVSADEYEARNMGVTGTPFVMLDGKITLAGALSPEIYLEALERAWFERENP